MNILPGILATTIHELKEQLHLVSFAKKVHLDVMDGRFVSNKTVLLHTLKKHFPKQDVQVHLMAHKPHRYIKPFSRLGAKELIIHAEATTHPCETLEDIRLAGMKSGIAFSPNTPIRGHEHPLIHSDLALVMTVHPGHSGQAFLKKPLEKIAAIKKHNPAIEIGVDGGINLGTCAIAARAGAHFSIATSAIQHEKHPQAAYRKLLAKSNVSPRI
ncbi:ribulose-phosphate 3-epimerase [Candidatus Woesearchaeota archaeon]|nr:MAG: ribulose-phosphate 3-epimerase [Candidatus Woesearchaeota archaeon]